MKPLILTIISMKHGGGHRAMPSWSELAALASRTVILATQPSAPYDAVFAVGGRVFE